MVYKLKKEKRGRPKSIFKVRDIRSSVVCPKGFRPHAVDWKRKKLTFKKVGRPKKRK